MKFVIGIDEVGRGPLAGPVSVATFSTTERTAKLILKNFFDGNLRDSKKLSEKKREEIFTKLNILKKEGKVSFKVAHSTPRFIDKFGISKAVQVGVKKSLLWQVQKYTNIFLLKKSSCPVQSTLQGISEFDHSKISNQIEIHLDGLLKAPQEFKNQKTIIKGDEKDIFIACASIVAKVSRDRLMCKLAKKHPGYGFEIHKGYGTKNHCKIIKKLGTCLIHRKSFCLKIEVLDDN